MIGVRFFFSHPEQLRAKLLAAVAATTPRGQALPSGKDLAAVAVPLLPSKSVFGKALGLGSFEFLSQVFLLSFLNFFFNSVLNSFLP
jgi:hypothetical protein